MKHAAVAVSLLVTVMPALAQAQGPDQPSAAAYERCLAEAAVQMSYREVRNEEVFSLAKRRCAGARAAVAKAPQMLAVLDAADATREANFPDWIGRLRERRQLRAIGLPIPDGVGYR